MRRRLLGDELVVLREQVEAVARAGALEPSATRKLWVLLFRELLFGPPKRAELRVGGTSIELGNHEGFAIDWLAFVEVFGDKPYATDYRDAFVLDIGAHKGYFGAFALSSGAAFVTSIEPARENCRALERSAAARPTGWMAVNAAVADSAGRRTLHLDSTSWAHSLKPVERPAGEEAVDVITLRDALALLPQAANARIVVKIDAEGAECEILHDPSPLSQVHEVFVEWHSHSGCSRTEIVDLMDSAGLRTVDAAEGGVLHFVRDGGPRE